MNDLGPSIHLDERRKAQRGDAVDSVSPPIMNRPVCSQRDDRKTERPELPQSDDTTSRGMAVASRRRFLPAAVG